jgi:hypothetical protein
VPTQAEATEHAPFILEAWETADEAAEEIRAKFQHYATTSPVDKARLDLVALLLGKVTLNDASPDSEPPNLNTWNGLEHLLDHFIRLHIHSHAMAELQQVDNDTTVTAAQ